MGNTENNVKDMWDMMKRLTCAFGRGKKRKEVGQKQCFKRIG